ncbi:MAG: hypothetical protein ACRC5C_00110, partial [Bacilli bacterium]
MKHNRVFILFVVCISIFASVIVSRAMSVERHPYTLVSMNGDWRNIQVEANPMTVRGPITLQQFTDGREVDVRPHQNENRTLVERNPLLQKLKVELPGVFATEVRRGWMSNYHTAGKYVYRLDRKVVNGYEESPSKHPFTLEIFYRQTGNLAHIKTGAITNPGQAKNEFGISEIVWAEDELVIISTDSSDSPERLPDTYYYSINAKTGEVQKLDKYDRQHYFMKMSSLDGVTSKFFYTRLLGEEKQASPEHESYAYYELKGISKDNKMQWEPA